MEIGPKAEDSLENTFSCVPKVQGDMPNLSGKRTEMLYAFLSLFSSPQQGLLFYFVFEGW